MNDELVRVHPEFYNTFSRYVIRDRKVVKRVRREMPHLPYNQSWRELTKELAKQYKKNGL